MSDVPPARPDDLIAAVERTPYGDLLRDESRRRRLVHEAMANGPDPTGREIGRQLMSGAATPRELLAASAYREFFQRARADGERLDLDSLTATARQLADNRRLTGDLDRDTGSGAGNRPDRDGGSGGAKDHRR